MEETPVQEVPSEAVGGSLSPAETVKIPQIPTDDKLNLKILQNKVLQLQIQYTNVGRNLQGMQKQLDDYAQGIYQQQQVRIENFVLDLETLAFVPRPQPPVPQTPKE